MLRHRCNFRPVEPCVCRNDMNSAFMAASREVVQGGKAKQVAESEIVPLRQNLILLQRDVWYTTILPGQLKHRQVKHHNKRNTQRRSTIKQYPLGDLLVRLAECRPDVLLPASALSFA